jgi:alkylhydroperoxidase family enzyme
VNGIVSANAEALTQLTLSIAAANFTNGFSEALGTELEA